MLQLILMCALMGAASLGCGMLPLAFALSRKHIERLSAVGTGLLLGAALGVIIPEGIESTVEAHPNEEVPTTKISLALLAGFTFMFLVEQLGAGHFHSGSENGASFKAKVTGDGARVEFDAELEDLERDERGRLSSSTRSSDEVTVVEADPTREKALPLTLGLVIHGLADGLALGVSHVATESPDTSLPFIVFLALILHKAPTALALTTSLLAFNLPRSECRKYLAVFAAATPISAVVCYLIVSIVGGSSGDWTGLALLISGGTFLYVATVLQPVSSHSPAAPDLQRVARAVLIVIGLFIPIVLSSFLGHGH